ncbi:MAG: helix-turn-helix domain-containing protein [Ardenticatenaceae bacterium]|nr:helix-turn-helix domain-containing protein [Ardenticatenaceae bacterium]
MDNLISARQAAKLLGVSRTTVSEWCQKGIIRNAQKVGATWAIPVSSLEDIERPKMGRPPETNGNANSLVPSQG